MINSERLLRFMDGYFGYGDLTAPFWFIGMEEGGEATVDHMNATLDRWHNENCPATVDIAPLGTTNPAFARDRPPIQRTWQKLIEAILTLQGVEPTTEAVRNYQKTTFARPNTAACLLEIMPLPARTTSDWNYDKLSEIPFLKSRKDYLAKVMPRRKERLRNLINSHNPKAVIFYSKIYFTHWKDIVGSDLLWTDNVRWQECRKGQTTFFSMPHPTAPGTSSEDYRLLGKALARLGTDE